MKGYLILENGEIYEGIRFGYEREVLFEAVLNTSMVGYIEIITDPAYLGQGIVMTYPLIGNYGIINEDTESNKMWCKALIVHELAEHESNCRSNKSLDMFLRENRIPGLTNVNTRKLAKSLFKNGSMRAAIVSNISNLDIVMEKIKTYKIVNPIENVTSKTAVTYGSTRPKRVALINYGVKDSIINELLKRKLAVTVYPATTPIEVILATRPDGILLSNGPGNPEESLEYVNSVKKIYKTNIPVLALGLGHEFMAMANDFKIFKLKYGHHGNSNSIMNLENRKIYQVEENHGYSVLEKSINFEVAEPTHINLEDGTIVGLKYRNKNIYTYQFYPEGLTSYVYDNFVNLVNGGNK